MSLFDTSAFERWRATAMTHLEAARHNRGTADHVAVFLSEQAAQCMLKGLLNGVGASSAAWGHAVLELARHAEQHAGLALDDEIEAGLRTLAREYQATRYPDVLPSGTPAEHFDQKDSDRAIQTAVALAGRVEQRFSELQAAASAEPQGKAPPPGREAGP